MQERIETANDSACGHSAFRNPNSALRNRPARAQRIAPRHRTAFTLVELLVVIAIIALLAALITAAAIQALAAGRRARINAEMEQISTAIEDYKNRNGSYPPDAQTDDVAGSTDSNPIDDAQVQRDFLRHFNKAFPNSRENPALLSALIGQGTGDQNDLANPNLPGGMTAAEALVFWLSLGQDAKYPISGQGGPAYVVSGANTQWHSQDPVETRNWALDINQAQLGPRDGEGFFAHVRAGTPGGYDRYLEYADPRDNSRTLRINFWRMLAAGSPVPYVYFDASRGSVTPETDTRAQSIGVVTGSAPTGPDQDVMRQLAEVYAVKAPGTTSNGARFRWANGDKFQLLHAGLDESFGFFPHAIRDSSDVIQLVALDPNNSAQTVSAEITFNEGPWTLELADTLTNFTDSTLEDAQP